MALPSNGFDMGAPLAMAEPEWSAGHRGCCLFTSRLLHPFWDAPLVVAAKEGGHVLRPRFSGDTLQVESRNPEDLVLGVERAKG